MFILRKSEVLSGCLFGFVWRIHPLMELRGMTCEGFINQLGGHGSIYDLVEHEFNVFFLFNNLSDIILVLQQGTILLISFTKCYLNTYFYIIIITLKGIC